MQKKILVLMLFLIAVVTTGCNLNPMAKKEVPQTYEEWVNQNGTGQPKPAITLPTFKK